MAQSWYPGMNRMFVPTDVELIDHYLRKKVNGEHIPESLIPVVNVFAVAPSELPRLPAEYRTMENERYFFTKREPVSKNSQKKVKRRASAATKEHWYSSRGYDVKKGSWVIGQKSCFFYMTSDDAGNKEEAEWQLQVFTLSDDQFQEWALVKVYLKGGKEADHHQEVENPLCKKRRTYQEPSAEAATTTVSDSIIIGPSASNIAGSCSNLTACGGGDGARVGNSSCKRISSDYDMALPVADANDMQMFDTFEYFDMLMQLAVGNDGKLILDPSQHLCEQLSPLAMNQVITDNVTVQHHEKTKAQEVTEDATMASCTKLKTEEASNIIVQALPAASRVNDLAKSSSQAGTIDCSIGSKPAVVAEKGSGVLHEPPSTWSWNRRGRRAPRKRFMPGLAVLNDDLSSLDFSELDRLFATQIWSFDCFLDSIEL